MRGHLRSAPLRSRLRPHPRGPCAGSKGCPPAGGSPPLRPYPCAQSPPWSGPWTPVTCGIAFCPIQARRRQKAQKQERTARRHKRPQASERAHGAGGSVLEVAVAPSACCDPSPLVPARTLAGYRAPTASAGDRTREKKRSGRGPTALASTPRDAPSAPSVAPALHQLCSFQPAAGAPGCAVQPRRRILSRPHPLGLPRLGRQLANRARQVMMSSPSPPGRVATPYRLFFASIGWVRFIYFDETGEEDGILLLLYIFG